MNEDTEKAGSRVGASDREVAEADEKLDMALEQNAMPWNRALWFFQRLRDARLFFHLMMKNSIEWESELRAAEKKWEGVSQAQHTAVCSWSRGNNDRTSSHQGQRYSWQPGRIGKMGKKGGTVGSIKIAKEFLGGSCGTIRSLRLDWSDILS